MRHRTGYSERTGTDHISLDTRKCAACWKCIEACKDNVIGRINLPWHKHARIVNSRDCTGCLRCVKTCEHGAIVKR